MEGWVAVRHAYRYVVNLDADFSHHPRYLPQLLARMEPGDGPAADVAIGSRYVPGGGIEGWPLRRHLMSRCVNTYARWLLGLRGIAAGPIAAIARRLGRAGLQRRLLPGLLLSRRDSLASETAGGPFRRGAHRVCRSTLKRSKINSREALAALWIIFKLGLENLRRRLRRHFVPEGPNPAMDPSRGSACPGSGVVSSGRPVADNTAFAYGHPTGAPSSFASVTARRTRWGCTRPASRSVRPSG